MAEAKSSPRKGQADLLPSGDQELFFENLPILLTVEEAATLLRVAEATIYDWNHHEILPKNVILKINGRLRLRTKALEQWISLQNSL